ncbi:TetR/AcrR family transcriptional regulator [Actinocorallia aurantiaca]|uniref:TetR/AcrR family transcriptional regulator n=1 Tax=Actinocorallia aurantiaca TaxID=46204 RepID=A0ABN3U1Z7_9ACTN
MTNRPAARKAPPAQPTRERLLDAAAELFYREGVGIGVEALCRSAGVSKRSMYQLFGSKDEVVAAALERQGPHYQEALLPPADHEGSPRDRILHVFRRLEETSADRDFRGCPFVAAAVELKSPDHPASRVARRYKGLLTAFFRAEAERGGAHDADLLAHQLTIAFDGASSWAVVQARSLDGLAVRTAEALLSTSGL